MTIHEATEAAYKNGYEAGRRDSVGMQQMTPIIEMIHNDIRLKQEDEIVKAVQECGINVDKKRLTQALSDAKAFYDEGYADGKRDAAKWIPVTERLPERGEKVLCYHKFSGEEWTDWKDTICQNTFNGICCGTRKPVWQWQGDYITHWMPLPALPKEGK